MEDRKTAVETLHRERIMDASERLFLEKGFQGTTISDISEAADYSRRTIYAYFESKDEILCGVVARGLRMLRDELRAVLGEKLTFVQYAGGVLIMAGIVVWNLYPAAHRADMKAGSASA